MICVKQEIALLCINFIARVTRRVIFGTSRTQINSIGRTKRN